MSERQKRHGKGHPGTKVIEEPSSAAPGAAQVTAVSSTGWLRWLVLVTDAPPTTRSAEKTVAVFEQVEGNADL